MHGNFFRDSQCTGGLCFREIKQGLHKDRNVVFCVEDTVQFCHDREMITNVHGFGELLVKDVSGCFSFKNKFMGNMFGEKTFANEQSECAITAQIIQGCEREISISAIIEQRIGLSAKSQQHFSHLPESCGQDKKTKVWRTELGVDNAQYNCIDVFKDAEYLHTADISGIIKMDIRVFKNVADLQDVIGVLVPERETGRQAVDDFTRKTGTFHGTQGVWKFFLQAFDNGPVPKTESFGQVD